MKRFPGSGLNEWCDYYKKLLEYLFTVVLYKASKIKEREEKEKLFNLGRNPIFLTAVADASYC